MFTIYGANPATANGTITARTDANGRIQFGYRAPIFGGEIEFVATTVSEGDTLVARDTLLVEVGDLELLPAGITYELVGAPNNHSGTNDPCRTVPPTSQHNSNHYGTQALITAIQNIAASYDSLHPGGRMRINDMSLENGGVFDINNDWNPPHAEHRLGRNADIGFSGIDQNNECVNLIERDIREAVRRYTNVRPYIHPDDHIHIRVNN